jgi:hypothetical protein
MQALVCVILALGAMASALLMRWVYYCPTCGNLMRVLNKEKLRQWVESNGVDQEAVYNYPFADEPQSLREVLDSTKAVRFCIDCWNKQQEE